MHMKQADPQRHASTMVTSAFTHNPRSSTTSAPSSAAPDLTRRGSVSATPVAEARRSFRATAGQPAVPGAATGTTAGPTKPPRPVGGGVRRRSWMSTSSNFAKLMEEDSAGAQRRWLVLWPLRSVNKTDPLQITIPNTTLQFAWVRMVHIIGNPNRVQHPMTKAPASPAVHLDAMRALAHLATMLVGDSDAGGYDTSFHDEFDLDGGDHEVAWEGGG